LATVPSSPDKTASGSEQQPKLITC